jgi:hypothetical protein
MKLQLCLNVTVSMLCAVLLGVSCSNGGAAPTAATSAPTTVALPQLKSESNPLLALAVQRAQPELDLLTAGLVSTKLYGSAWKSTSVVPNWANWSV